MRDGPFSIDPDGRLGGRVRLSQDLPFDHDAIPQAWRNDLLRLRGFGDQANGACPNALFPANGGSGQARYSRIDVTGWKMKRQEIIRSRFQ